VEGIDVVIAFDLSSSMKAADFVPQSRLHVAKEVLKAFVGRRPNDRIGLVVFAGEAYTRAPLTLDSGLLRELVDGLRFGAIDDGTAIGNALATALNRLRESDAKSKAIVLITDGDNNAGQISPLEAAGMAKALGVRVFPILVGTGGVVPYPVGTDVFGKPIYERREFPVNPGLLEKIAAETGGAFAVATDREGLEHGLQAALDRMEKSRLFEPGGVTRRSERFAAPLAWAFALSAAALALGATRLRSFP
jgi:Ca-activated chloride channel family protein